MTRRKNHQHGFELAMFLISTVGSLITIAAILLYHLS